MAGEESFHARLGRHGEGKAGMGNGVGAVTAHVRYRGVLYRLDLARCRRALVMRQVEGEVSSLDGLAKRARLSRSTASRFFAGRSLSLGATLRILAVLRLKFEDVVEAMEEP